MKPGLNRNTGHDWELAHYQDKNPTHCWKCKLCKQWFWGAKTICPKKQIKVKVPAEVWI